MTGDDRIPAVCLSNTCLHTDPAKRLTDTKYKEILFEKKPVKDLEGNERIVENKRSKDLPKRWNSLRTMISTMKNNSNIGRNLYFIVEDEITNKLLGTICISSDFLDLTPRDKWIGWDRETKTQGNMINHTAIGSSIVPTQPLGFNYVGGKLLALMCLSDTVQNTWKKQLQIQKNR